LAASAKLIAKLGYTFEHGHLREVNCLLANTTLTHRQRVVGVVVAVVVVVVFLMLVKPVSLKWRNKLAAKKYEKWFMWLVSLPGALVIFAAL